jgi:ABC-type histidine transport system ATPase subunit
MIVAVQAAVMAKAGSMNTAITATGLRKSFGGKAVPDGIDLEVGAGTTFSLLGPNGAARPPPCRPCPRWSTPTAARYVSQAMTWLVECLPLP